MTFQNLGISVTILLRPKRDQVLSVQNANDTHYHKMVSAILCIDSPEFSTGRIIK